MDIEDSRTAKRLEQRYRVVQVGMESAAWGRKEALGNKMPWNVSFLDMPSIPEQIP